MYKLNVFLLPCKNYHSLTYEELMEFDGRVSKLEMEENFQIPKKFYDTKDINQQTVYDVIFEGIQTDISDYLLELLTKRRQLNIDYAEIENSNDYAYTAIVDRDIEENKKDLSIFDMEDKIDLNSRYRGVIPNDVIRVKRSHLVRCKTFNIFKEKAEFCFHRLVFHPDAFVHISKLGRCEEVIEELMRHLCVLNDYGDKVYDYTCKNEKNALLELQSSFQIYCSGKGSNETLTYNKDMIFNGKKYKLTCNPHTKLFKKYSNQRIYFCWGQDDIENHKIIIIRIGNHWEE